MMESAKRKFALNVKEATGKNINIQPQITSQSQYLKAGGKKLAIINVQLELKDFNLIIRSVYIYGIVKSELVKVTCARQSNHEISLSSGACANEIESALGVKIIQ